MPSAKLINTYIIWNCWYRRRTWSQNIQNHVTRC